MLRENASYVSVALTNEKVIDVIPINCLSLKLLQVYHGILTNVLWGNKAESFISNETTNWNIIQTPFHL